MNQIKVLEAVATITESLNIQGMPYKKAQAEPIFSDPSVPAGVGDLSPHAMEILDQAISILTDWFLDNLDDRDLWEDAYPDIDNVRDMLLRLRDNQPTKYRHESLMASGWEPVNDNTFPTKGEAYEDLYDFLLAQNIDYEACNMDTRYEIQNWRVAEVTS